MKKLLALVVAGSAMVACSTNQAPVQAPVAAPVIASAPVADTAGTNHNAVYFAFNKYDIQDQYAGIVKANADYLAANPQAKTQVQGNTDDIGSVEYNLSLGQKRADATKKALIAAGASKSQIEATSNGKVNPKFANDTDSDRAMNRRADIIFQADQPKGYSTENGMPVVDSSVYSGTVAQGVQ